MKKTDIPLIAPPPPEGAISHAPVDNACFLGNEHKPQAPKLKEALATIKNWFRANSLWVMAYGTGCGSIELRPLTTARFDFMRFGMAMRPTPRQSNVLIISGYLAVKSLKRVIRSYEQMPSPKWIVGLGSCTINGGMYWDSYNTIKRLDDYLPVDIFINGCMPRPEGVIDGFIELQKLISSGQAMGWKKYQDNLDWYRVNQKKVIKNWNMPDYNW